MKRVVFLMILVLCVAACSNVQPWERGYLARDIMAWDIDGQKAAFDRHINFSKEGSSGGGQAVGGGCGCN